MTDQETSTVDEVLTINEVLTIKDSGKTSVGFIPGGGENVSLASELRTRLYRYIMDQGRVKNQVLREAISEYLKNKGY